MPENEAQELLNEEMERIAKITEAPPDFSLTVDQETVRERARAGKLKMVVEPAANGWWIRLADTDVTTEDGTLIQDIVIVTTKHTDVGAFFYALMSRGEESGQALSVLRRLLRHL